MNGDIAAAVPPFLNGQAFEKYEIGSSEKLSFSREDALLVPP